MIKVILKETISQRFIWYSRPGGYRRDGDCKILVDLSTEGLEVGGRLVQLGLFGLSLRKWPEYV
jgi:hypothetical protein